MSSSSFKPGEIVIAPIPFSTHTDLKVRPALVISRESYNARSDDLVVLKVTSKVKDYPFDVMLEQKDLENGTLKEASVISADFPVVIEKKSITKPIGTISLKKMSEVKQKIKELYELP